MRNATNKSYLIYVLLAFWAIFAAQVVSADSESKVHSQSEGESEAKTDSTAAQTETQGEQSKEAAEEFSLPEGVVWETNDTDPVFADPKAKKGGTFLTSLHGFPETFRTVGENSSSARTQFPLLRNELPLTLLHPHTGRALPALATHWAVAKDNVTVYFKLHPKARWSDGKPVSVEDFAFMYELKRSPHILDPRVNNQYTEEIVDLKVHARDVISVVSGISYPKDILILKIGTEITPMPKHFHKLDKDWPRRFNYKIAPNTGPFKISAFKKGQFVKFSRKKDWWAKDLKYFQNSYNMDHIHYKVIRDDESRWQHFATGDIYVHDLVAPENWYDKPKTTDAFQKGYIQKVKMFMEGPEMAGGLWLNTEREVWKDQNVRRAFAHAMNYDKVIKEVYRGDPVRFHGIYVNFDEYSDPSLETYGYDPEKVKELMQAAGYELNEKGFWNKDGKPLSVKILFYQPTYVKEFVLLAEEAKKAGFEVVLNERDSKTWYKYLMEGNYDVARVRFSSGGGLIPPPMYGDYFDSDQAVKQGYNVSKIRDKKLDKLIDEYREAMDAAKKQKLSREILAYIHELAVMVPRVYMNFQRIGLWRGWKLPTPPGGKRYAWGGLPHEGVIQYVWFDEEEHKRLKAYKKAGKSFSD